jgi:hypothetical protein
MEKYLRNAIGTAAQNLRKTLEEEYFEQLEGVFDVHRAGTIAQAPGAHLSHSERVIRSKIVGALQYHRSSGLDQAEAVARFVRDQGGPQSSLRRSAIDSWVMAGDGRKVLLQAA